MYLFAFVAQGLNQGPMNGGNALISCKSNPIFKHLISDFSDPL